MIVCHYEKQKKLLVKKKKSKGQMKAKLGMVYLFFFFLLILNTFYSQYTYIHILYTYIDFINKEIDQFTVVDEKVA